MSNYPSGNQYTAEEREEVIIKLMPRIKSWVIRMCSTLPDSVDMDDLYSSACLGLIESLERFDKDRNVNFYTFAERRIKGAILDTLRSLDFLPRNVRTRLKQLEAYIEKHYRAKGERPTPEEIAADSDFEINEIHRLLEVLENDKLLSLDEKIGAEGESNLVDFIKSSWLTPEDETVRNSLIAGLGEHIELLPEKERLVITLYYYEELTMKEIAEVLGITESRVSQIHSSTVVKLQKKLREYYE